MSEIKPFLCDTIDKSMLRHEWEKWLRSFSLYLEAEEITSIVKKKSKLLHLGGPQLQEIIYNIPGALVEYDTTAKNDVYAILVGKLDEYFVPERNSVFERHIFRNLSPIEGESFNRYLVRLRQQLAKCSYGTTKAEIEEICMVDKIIDSWASTDLKKRFLEKEQTLDEIINACKISEQITKHSQGILGTESSGVVSKISVKNRYGKDSNKPCIRCGYDDHNSDSTKCPARNKHCKRCNLLGHFAKQCRTRNLKRPADTTKKFNPKKRKELSNVRNIEDRMDSDEDCRELECFRINGTSERDDDIMCSIGGEQVQMVIDSGSPANLLCETHWHLLNCNNAVMWNVRSQSTDRFRAYATDKPLKVLKIFEAPISVRENREVVATFYVVEKGSQSLLGKKTATQLNVLKLGLEACRVEMVHPFPKIKNRQIKLSIDLNVKPVQQSLRRVPVAVEEKVSAKLDEACSRDIIESVKGPSAWISPIVVVFKEDGEIRLCIDMRLANKAILRENYPLPTFEMFIAKARGAKYFSRLDLKDAYHQLELHESSREITTFITHKGLFRYKRLLFGVNSAPEIFQRVLAEILAPCKNAHNYLDDVIIFGKTELEHDEAVREVLKICEDNDVLLNKSKCVYKATELKFLGHILSSSGVKADPEKVKLILNFRPPETKEELRSFLGLVTYVGKFIADLSHITEPLRVLLKANTKFMWSSCQEKAFRDLKERLAHIPDLSYFDPKNRTQVIADASPVALGGVLLQFNNNNDPLIISFASKSLSDVERRYSQTEKESLALVWAVEKFFYYLAGLEFDLVTDHKPLEAIFKPTSKPPARIERWVLRLQAFKFRVVYRPGKENIADSVSRLCKIGKCNSFDEGGDYNICHIVSCATPKSIPIPEIAKESAADNEICTAISQIKNDNWQAENSNCYYPFRHELSSIGTVLLRGTRIVIPEVLRKRVLHLAHEGHPGESAMKRRLRAKVWWPGLDREAEQHVKTCKSCLLVSNPPHPPPMQRHVFPNGPWQFVATDLLGPLPNNDNILVLIDYYSRYQEVKFLSSISSQAIITAMMEIFSRLGIPRSLRTDNGRQFVSSEFKNFCEGNGIALVTTPPYWPQANGEVENMNRSLVKRLKIATLNKANLKGEIQKFILTYNVTPHGTTGLTPTELMFNRTIRDKLPDIRDLADEIVDSSARDNDLVNKQKGKEVSDKRRGARESTIDVGDKVLVKNVVFPSKLTPNFDLTEYEVVGREGNEVELLGGGRKIKRNVGHCKKVPSPQPPTDKAGSHLASSRESLNQSQGLHANPSSDNLEQCSHPNKHIDEGKPTAGLRLKLKKKGEMWQPCHASNA